MASWREEKIAFCYFSELFENYIPLDLGYAMACLEKKGFKRGEMIKLTSFYSEKEEVANGNLLDEEVARIVHCCPSSVIFFVENVFWSNFFAWERAIKLSLELKKKNPSLKIGIRSCKASFRQIKKALNEQKIDFVIRGESEKVFPDLGGIFLNEKIEGVFYAGDKSSNLSLEENLSGMDRKEKVIKRNDPFDFSLDGILLSPYLAGIFDDFLEDFPTAKPVFVYASKGCFYGCYYCYRSVRSYRRVYFFSPKRFYDEISYLHRKFSLNNFFVLDDIFPYSKSQLKLFLEEYEKRKKEYPTLQNIKLSVMSRIELLNEEIVNLFPKLNIQSVQIGLQTINPMLQEYMNRTLDLNRFKDVARSFRKSKVRLNLDIIAGLPEDSFMFFKKTVDFAISLQPHLIQVNKLFINPGTKFSKEAAQYGIKVDNNRRDFYAPRIVESKGINSRYFDLAKEYLYEKSELFPEIKWGIRF